MGHRHTLTSNQRLNAVIRVWGKNLRIGGRVVVIYSRRVEQFITYCKERGIAPEEAANHAGVLFLARWYARSKGLNVGCTISAARPALHAGRDPPETGRNSIPPWQSLNALLHDLPPLLRELADDMRQHRGCAESTIRSRILAVERFITFLQGRHRRVRDLRLADIDAYVVGCAKCYTVATIASICSTAKFYAVFRGPLDTLRIVAGAVSVSLSFWMLLFSVLLLLSLAFVKRYAELDGLRKRGQLQAVGRGYEVSDLPILQSLGCASGYLSVLFLAVYVNSPDVKALYRHPTIIWACVCADTLLDQSCLDDGAARCHARSPVVYASNDGPSIGIGCLAVLVAVVAF